MSERERGREGGREGGGGGPDTELKTKTPHVNVRKNDGTSPFLLGKSTINRQFSIANCLFTRG